MFAPKRLKNMFFPEFEVFGEKQNWVIYVFLVSVENREEKKNIENGEKSVSAVSYEIIFEFWSKKKFLTENVRNDIFTSFPQSFEKKFVWEKYFFLTDFFQKIKNKI